MTSSNTSRICAVTTSALLLASCAATLEDVFKGAVPTTVGVEYGQGDVIRGGSIDSSYGAIRADWQLGAMRTTSADPELRQISKQLALMLNERVPEIADDIGHIDAGAETIENYWKLVGGFAGLMTLLFGGEYARRRWAKKTPTQDSE